MYEKCDIMYVGVNDYQTDLFESQYLIEDGIAYNSYMIMDEKIAVLDSVDTKFTKEWLKNVKEILHDRQPSYIIVQHMEPDHSGSIQAFLNVYPDAKIVATSKAFQLMKQFFGTDYPERQITVGENDVLNLGRHELKFILAPMVHWPEVMLTYDPVEQALFSADAFGKFGALGTIDDWACEARRYYFGIVGKYGAAVQSLLKKLEGLPLKAICPLHGPVLKSNLERYINLYRIWSSYGVETEGVMIAYTSIYGHTKAAVDILARHLAKLGCPKIILNDLARCDMTEVVEDAFRYGKIVLATTTYNMDLFPPMRTFLNQLIERNFQNRTIALIENGSWAPTAAKLMKEQLAECKNLTYTDTSIRIMSALTPKNIQQLNDLAKELMS